MAEAKMNEDVVLAFKLYNLAAQTLIRALQSGGVTIEEVRASVDAEEQKFFDEVEARIQKLKSAQ